MEATFEKIDKLFGIVFLHTGNIKRDPINFEFSFILVVVELGPVKSYELQDHHCDGKEV